MKHGLAPCALEEGVHDGHSYRSCDARLPSRPEREGGFAYPLAPRYQSRRRRAHTYRQPTHHEERYLLSGRAGAGDGKRPVVRPLPGGETRPGSDEAAFRNGHSGPRAVRLVPGPSFPNETKSWKRKRNAGALEARRTKRQRHVDRNSARRLSTISSRTTCF